MINANYATVFHRLILPNLYSVILNIRYIHIINSLFLSSHFPLHLVCHFTIFQN